LILCLVLIKPCTKRERERGQQVVYIYIYIYREREREREIRTYARTITVLTDHFVRDRPFISMSPMNILKYNKVILPSLVSKMFPVDNTWTICL